MFVLVRSGSMRFAYRELESLDYHCKDKRKMGNRLACFDNGVMNTNSCIVYSFG